MFIQKNVLTVAVLIAIVLAGLAYWESNRSTPRDGIQTPGQADLDPAGAGPGDPSDASDFEEQLPAFDWMLSSLTIDKQPVNLKAKASPQLTLNFDTRANTFTGFSGCNTIGGTYTASKNHSFTFGALTRSQKSCPGVDDLELAITRAMGKVASVDVKGDQLIFTSIDGHTELVYNPVK